MASIAAVLCSFCHSATDSLHCLQPVPRCFFMASCCFGEVTWFTKSIHSSVVKCFIVVPPISLSLNFRSPADESRYSSHGIRELEGVKNIGREDLANFFIFSQFPDEHEAGPEIRVSMLLAELLHSGFQCTV